MKTSTKVLIGVGAVAAAGYFYGKRHPDTFHIGSWFPFRRNIDVAPELIVDNFPPEVAQYSGSSSLPLAALPPLPVLPAASFSTKVSAGFGTGAFRNFSMPLHRFAPR